MQGSDPKNEATPVITIIERRRQREADLSPADVMKILRKRSAVKKGSSGCPGGASGV
jgi:hypothetical protein